MTRDPTVASGGALCRYHLSCPGNRVRYSGSPRVSQETRTSVNRGHLPSVFSGRLTSALTAARGLTSPPQGIGREPPQHAVVENHTQRGQVDLDGSVGKGLLALGAADGALGADEVLDQLLGDITGEAAGRRTARRRAP